MRTSGYILYAAGQLGVMLLSRYFFQWVIRFSDGTAPGATAALFSAAWVGAIFFVFRLFDAAIDPWIGAQGDAWVKKGRERRSFLGLALLWAPLGMGLVFSPSLEMSELVRWVFLLVGMFFFFVGYSAYTIPLWSLLEDYSQGEERVRVRLSNAQGVGLLLATGIGFVVTPFLISRLGFTQGAWIISGLALLLMILPYFAAPKTQASVHLGSSEEQLGLSQPGLSQSGAEERSTRQLLRLVLSDKSFLRVVVLFAGAQMSFTVMTAAAPYLAEKLLGGTLKDVPLLLGPFLLTTLLGFIFVPRLAARWGWQRAVFGGALLLGGSYLGAGLLGQAWLGSAWVTAMLVFACAGPGASLILGLEGEAIARSAHATDRQAIGTYFGVYNMIVQATNGLALAGMGFLAESARQSVGAVRFMPVLAGLLCLLGLILSRSLFRRSARLAVGEPSL